LPSAVEERAALRARPGCGGDGLRAPTPGISREEKRGAATPLPPGDGGKRIFDNGVTAAATAAQGRERAAWREGDPLPLVEAQAWELTEPLTPERCREVFDAVQPFTLGIEEELMLVDPETLELSPSIALELGVVDVLRDARVLLAGQAADGY